MLDLEMFDDEIKCFRTSLEMNVSLYGYDNMLTAIGYELLASAFYSQRDLKKPFEIWAFPEKTKWICSVSSRWSKNAENEKAAQQTKMSMPR